ncbi:hypothetical protein PFLCHA0_c13840 [Pseudomonas protegens CHA0]|uniref:Uncharacterized protein n=1 Tax=Pseudomonas protegens (strain DSM 19095 / LMG 27888 / CFBP 6595 / CHA0) TaxID=1124983 RepID=A0A2C9EHP8_PSEPH|nr:hypothetical protein PFLCHA0_c13840 [Pseudomonas protegens CHA0]
MLSPHEITCSYYWNWRHGRRRRTRLHSRSSGAKGNGHWFRRMEPGV